MDVPIMLLTPEHYAAGYVEFDGIDGEGRIRVVPRRFRKVGTTAGGVLVIDPAKEHAKLHQERVRR